MDAVGLDYPVPAKAAPRLPPVAERHRRFATDYAGLIPANDPRAAD